MTSPSKIQHKFIPLRGKLQTGGSGSYSSWPLNQSLMCSLAMFLLFVFATQSAAAEQNHQAIEVFEKVVRPILSHHCYECHGPETDGGEGNLRLDSLAEILQGGDTGPAIGQGSPLQSLLLHAVNHDPTLTAMPPAKKLSLTEISGLTRWVQLKGPWPVAGLKARPQRPKTSFHISEEDRKFWAFTAPALPSVPDVRDRTWVRNPIDRFVLSQLERGGIGPVPPAGKRDLIRRSTYDLHGLPPTSE
ncbi:MAG: DUF1549 domain-containing protein, partial [Fuerstiella sp.]|nr:DUF1549 domain-containing protein [Fuerstiella sp.]